MNNAKRRGEVLLEVIKERGFTTDDLKMAVSISEEAESIKKPIKEQQIEDVVEEVCSELHIPSNFFGYKFLKELITKIVRNEETLTNLKKEAYSRIALKNELPVDSIDRSIDNVIQITYEKGNKEELAKMFEKNSKPSNAEFVRKVADMVKAKLDEKSAS